MKMYREELDRVEEIELLHLLFRCLLLEKSRSLCYSLRLLLFAQRVTCLKYIHGLMIE